MERSQALHLKSILVATTSIVLTSFLIGCAGNQSESVANDSNSESLNPSVTNESMSIEGTVTEVMESWPLQLFVETTTGSYYVELLLETTITQAGEEVEANRLIPNTQVVITGEASPTQENSMIAKTIEIK